MARQLSALDVYHRMTGIFRLDDTATTSAIEAATPSAKGDLTITLTVGGGASFTAGDEIRIGGQGTNSETGQIDSIAVDVLTLKAPLTRAVLVLEVVTLLVRVDLGAPDENGVNLETSQDEVEVEAGDRQNTYLFIAGNLDEALTLALRDFNVENIATVHGLDETDVTIIAGKGIALPVNDFNSLGFRPWVFEGLLEGNEAVTGYVFAAKVVVNNVALQFAFGVATTLPLNMRSIGNRSFLIE